MRNKKAFSFSLNIPWQSSGFAQSERSSLQFSGLLRVIIPGTLFRQVEMTMTMMMMMMKTMFIVLVRRCQGVRLIGQHCPTKTEQEQSLVVFSVVLLLFFYFSCDHHLYHYHHHDQFAVMFTAHSSFHVSLCWLSCRFVDIRMVSSKKTIK